MDTFITKEFHRQKKSFFALTLAFLILPNLFAQEVKERPQEPSKPYPYLSEDITFQNQEADITLAGTLTLPRDLEDFPVVVLISGSSPHTRNQVVAGHKSFLVLADYLTRNGIGVLRYDDRGVGGSEGTYEIAAYDDRTNDALSALAYLKTRKEINPNKMGVIGHSEGGLIAPRVATRSDDVSFIISMGAPALPAGDLILLKTELGHRANGMDATKSQTELAFFKSIFDPVIASKDLAKTKAELSSYFEANPDKVPEGMKTEQVNGMLGTFASSWFQRLLQYDPRTELENVRCSVLAINGTKDLQMPAKENLSAIEQALEKGGNEDYKIMELEDLNHLLQEAETGSEEEFETISQTMSPIALNAIAKWIERL